MARSPAQRQAAFRQRRPEAGDNGDRRMDTWVTTGTVLALARLTRRQGVTQRAMLEQMIRAADDAVTATLAPGTPEWDAYFAVTG